MVALLNSTGFYKPTIKDTVRRDTVRFKNANKDEYRVSIDFTINPGKQLMLDSPGLCP